MSDEKRAAVSVLANSPVAILTGDPGTGKTVTIKSLTTVLERAGYQVHLTAPTGRAAARLTEATGRPAQTLHRLLHNNRQQEPFRDLFVPQIQEVIISGIVPELPSPAETKSDCYFIEADNVLAIQQLVVNAATRSLPNRCGADPHSHTRSETPEAIATPD